jgi:hypothetical protein
MIFGCGEIPQLFFLFGPWGSSLFCFLFLSIRPFRTEKKKMDRNHSGREDWDIFDLFGAARADFFFRDYSSYVTTAIYSRLFFFFFFLFGGC